MEDLRMKLLSSEAVWGDPSPQTFLHKLFHSFKQQQEFISPRYGRETVRAICFEWGFSSDLHKNAVNLVLFDYTDNTEMRTLKYGLMNRTEFVKFYTALLEANNIKAADLD